VPLSEMLDWENEFSQDTFNPTPLERDTEFINPQQRYVASQATAVAFPQNIGHRFLTEGHADLSIDDSIFFQCKGFPVTRPSGAKPQAVPRTCLISGWDDPVEADILVADPTYAMQAQPLVKTTLVGGNVYEEVPISLVSASASSHSYLTGVINA
jgi:hypothetical protein